MSPRLDVAESGEFVPVKGDDRLVFQDFGSNVLRRPRSESGAFVLMDILKGSHDFRDQTQMVGSRPGNGKSAHYLIVKFK